MDINGSKIIGCTTDKLKAMCFAHGHEYNERAMLVNSKGKEIYVTYAVEKQIKSAK